MENLNKKEVSTAHSPISALVGKINEEKSRKVAEFQVGGDVSLNPGAQNPDLAAPVDETTLPPKKEEAPEEEPIKVYEKPKKTQTESQDYSDYSPWALLAVQKQNEGALDPSLKIPKELTGAQFDQVYSRSIENAVMSKMETNVEVHRLAQFLLDGGDPQIAQKVINAPDFSEMDPSKTEEAKKIMHFVYANKGLSADDIESLLDADEINDRLIKKATSHQKQLKSMKDKQYENMLQQQAIIQQQEEEALIEARSYNESLIGKGKIKGFTIPKTQRAAFISAVYDRTEPVTIKDPYTGEPERVLYSKLELVNSQIAQDPEAQLAFAWMALNGFDLGEIKEQGKIEQNLNILEQFNGKVSSVTSEEPSGMEKNLTKVHELFQKIT